MRIPIHRVSPTYNATPRRVERLAKHLTDYLLAEQSIKQAKGKPFVINIGSMIDALEAFVDPRNYRK